MNEMMTCNVADRVRSAFNFSIDKFPLSGPDSMRTPFYGLFKSDTGTAVGSGSVSDRYTPHTTDDVLALVEAAGTAFGGVADVRTHFDHGHYVTVQPTKEQRLAVFGTKDNVFPRIVIDAGYGGQAFRASLGLYRDACRNMMILRQAEGTHVAIRHTSGLRLQMDELIATFASLEAGWGNLSLVVQHMQGREVRMVEFLNAIYGEPKSDEGRSVTMHKHRTEAIFRRLSSERMTTGRGPLGSDFVVTGWEAFNAIQGYTQHDSIRRGRPTEMERIVRALHDNRVAHAERLALTMAV
jgi:hypothetical protein